MAAKKKATPKPPAPKSRVTSKNYETGLTTNPSGISARPKGGFYTGAMLTSTNKKGVVTGRYAQTIPLKKAAPKKKK
jgi:hypothetical protein